MHALEKMFRPRSVAVIGASADPEKLGGRTLQYIKELGYHGWIFPINVSGKPVQGLPSWPSVADLPEVPDSALVLVPAPAVAKALEDCVAKGILHAQVLSSGFAEEGGEGIAMQERVVEIVRRTGMRITGPNCLGSISPPDGYFGTFSSLLATAKPPPGKVPASRPRAAPTARTSTRWPASATSASAVPSRPATKPTSTSPPPSTTWRRTPAPPSSAPRWRAARMATGCGVPC
jgi:acyl-CoA synthetase (NDP forming)